MTIGTNPPLVIHSEGCTVYEANNHAAMAALKALGQQTVQVCSVVSYSSHIR